MSSVVFFTCFHLRDGALRDVAHAVDGGDADVVRVAAHELSEDARLGLGLATGLVLLHSPGSDAVEVGPPAGRPVDAGDAGGTVQPGLHVHGRARR